MVCLVYLVGLVCLFGRVDLVIWLVGLDEERMAFRLAQDGRAENI
jgi:hypothetical protein